MLRNKSSSSNNRKRANCNNLKNKIRTFMKTSITMIVTVTTNGKSNGKWSLTRLGSPYSQRWSQRLHGLQSHTAFARSTQVMDDQPHKIRNVCMHIIHTLMPKQIFIAKAYLVLHQIKQGNYSLRRPPKLIIPQAVIRHWEKMSFCMHIDV